MMEHTDMFSVAAEGMAEQLEIHAGLPDLSHSLSGKIDEEVNRYLKSGNFLLQNVSGVMFMNPILLDLKSLKWEVQHILNPSECYLPLTTEERNIHKTKKKF